MTDEPRDQVYGTKMSDWIAGLSVEVVGHPLSLWHINAEGKNYFGLADATLAEFIRRVVRALLDAGAVPVTTSRGTAYEYIALHRYGHEREVIIESIMSEWEASAKDDEYLFSVWFALPSEAVGNLSL